MGAEGKREAAGGEESTLAGAHPRAGSDARGICLRCVNNFCYYFVVSTGEGEGGGSQSVLKWTGRDPPPLGFVDIYNLK